MIDIKKQRQKELAKEKTRRRMNVQIDPDNYVYYPEEKQVDPFDQFAEYRVVIYVRVSTDDVKQTTSYELQKKYYEDFVVHHPNWTLVHIYADEGISGTQRKHSKDFNQMIVDAKAGMFDMIVCKNVSRFARNVTDCIGIVRDLADLKNPVGVFFESECIFSLKEDSQMGLSFLATLAEEESHTRSRSMETSLRMRLDNGIPLTPKLLGYTHDSEGQLIINPEEAPTVKLCFFMYLYGYSTQQIADVLIALGRKSYLGNIKWTAGGIVQILRNERHCGDVLTRKTYTPNFRTHLSKKNKGKRPQSRYLNHHEAIVSRDDFIAVQQMIDNAKYRNKSYLPELRVIDSGIFKGYVTINPRWAAFKEAEYYQASQSVYPKVTDGDLEELVDAPDEFELKVEKGDFDLRGFEITRSEFFDSNRRPAISFSDRRIKFNAPCVRKFAPSTYAELLINPIERKLAIRPSDKSNRSSVIISKLSNKRYTPREVPAAAFYDTIFSIFEWNKDYKYRIIGSLYEQDGELAYIFDAADSEAFVQSFMLPAPEASGEDTSDLLPVTPSGKRIRAIPEEWTNTFGKDFYEHELSLAALESQSEQDWKLRLEGRLFETGRKINVTGFDELRSYIKAELSGLTLQEVIT